MIALYSESTIGGTAPEVMSHEEEFYVNE